MDLKLFRSYQKAVSPDDENYLEDSMTFINDSLVKLGMSGRQGQDRDIRNQGCSHQRRKDRRGPGSRVQR